MSHHTCNCNSLFVDDARFASTVVWKIGPPRLDLTVSSNELTSMIIDETRLDEKRCKWSDRRAASVWGG